MENNKTKVIIHNYEVSNPCNFQMCVTEINIVEYIAALHRGDSELAEKMCPMIRLNKWSLITDERKVSYPTIYSLDHRFGIPFAYTIIKYESLVDFTDLKQPE